MKTQGLALGCGDVWERAALSHCKQERNGVGGLGSLYPRIGAFPSSSHPFIFDPLKLHSVENLFSAPFFFSRQPNLGGLDGVGDGEKWSSRE